MKDDHSQDSNPQGRRPDAGAAASNGLKVVEAVRQGAAALQQGGRAASDAARRSYVATAGVARQNTQTGVEAMLRIGETAKETV